MSQSHPLAVWAIGGLEHGFMTGVLQRRRVGVPLLLNQICFYRDRDEITAFAGRLPFGLTWSDDRNQARQRMQPWAATRRSYLTDCWDLPWCRGARG